MEEGRGDDNGGGIEGMNWLIMIVWIIGTLWAVWLGKVLSR
jgi:hypothetical protein